MAYDTSMNPSCLPHVLRVRLYHNGHEVGDYPQVKQLTFCTSDGPIQVYPGHAPWLYTLQAGSMVVHPYDAPGEHVAQVGEGVVHIEGSEVQVFYA